MTNKDFKPLFNNLNMNPARGENETYDELIPVTKSPLNNVVIKNDYVQVI